MDDIRVMDGESGAHQTIDIIDRRSLDIWQCGGVDDNFDTLEIMDGVFGVDAVIQSHAVLVARTAAGTHEQAEGEVRLGLGGEKVAQVSQSGRRQGDGGNSEHKEHYTPFGQKVNLAPKKTLGAKQQRSGENEAGGS